MAILMIVVIIIVVIIQHRSSNIEIVHYHHRCHMLMTVDMGQNRLLQHSPVHQQKVSVVLYIVTPPLQRQHCNHHHGRPSLP